MVIIEIELNNNNLGDINSNVDNEVNNLKQKLETVINYIGTNSFQDENIFLNYYNQEVYVAKAFTKEMEKAEQELLKKCGLENVEYVGNEDNGILSVTSVIIDNLTNKFDNASNMSEINNDEVLNNCKNAIVDYFNNKLDEYAKEYKIDNELLANVKDDIPHIVSKHFDKTANKLFNDNVRDELNNLCNELENAYNIENFTEMTEITEKISKYLSKDTTIYRDEELFKKLKTNMAKSKMIQSKLRNGQEGSLSEFEESLITKFNNEQTENINKDYKDKMGFFKEDVSTSRFSTETDIMRELFDKIYK